MKPNKQLTVVGEPSFGGTCDLTAQRFPHCRGDFFANHISVALDKGAPFEIEELADLKLIVGVRGEELPFDYLIFFHLLRAIPAEPTEFIIFVSERSGHIAVNAGSERIGDAHGCIVLGMRYEDRSVNALLIDDAAKEALHAFRESIM